MGKMKRTIALLFMMLAACALYAQDRPRLAILPFTGSNAEDAETIAEFFSYEREITRNFIPVPRTRTVENIMREQRFQRSGLTDSDTISELGRQMNADYVLAGHITSLGQSKLLLITIIHVEELRQIAGDYREYRRIEETDSFLLGMARRISAAARQDVSRLPRLAVLPFNALSSGVNQEDAEVLSQILATDIANSGRYAVFPRTRTIEAVMTEHRIQRSGMTDPENIRRIGAAVNAQYVLSANFRSLGTNKYFSAAILDVTLGDQGEVARKQYRNVSEGLTLMAELARELTGIGANMVRINAGTFTMGSPDNEPERITGEGPQHQVTVSSFYMGKYEVTQKEYQELMGVNPTSYPHGDNLPVTGVSWYDAIDYCNALSRKEGLTPAYTMDKNRIDPTNTSIGDDRRGINDDPKWLVTWNRNANGYRLPTEAEWEYACRAGTTTPFNTGNNITTDQANYNGYRPYNKNVMGQYRQDTIPVGSLAPNPWGLYDMHGNVEEWCWDWWGSYPSGAQTDPVGAASGGARVVRGGSFDYWGKNLRSAYRELRKPYFRSDSCGIRLVRPAQ
jgi:formylglycine-generating enzyme required for sulfatase activity